MYLGVDEAGRGPALGPLVVAGLVAPDQDSLHNIGVRDSKMLSENKRNQLFSILSESNYHCILEVPASTIDIARDEMTLNKLEVLCFASIIASLHRGELIVHPLIKGKTKMTIGGIRSSISRAILDAADVNEKRFGQEVLEETRQMEDVGGIGFLSKHKADRDHPVVGAASILAKVTRDDRIKQISADIGENIGSGYPSDPYTKKFLKSYVDRKGDLPTFARRSWETCLKLVPRIGQRTLMDF